MEAENCFAKRTDVCKCDGPDRKRNGGSGSIYKKQYEWDVRIDGRESVGIFCHGGERCECSDAFNRRHNFLGWQRNSINGKWRMVAADHKLLCSHRAEAS